MDRKLKIMGIYLWLLFFVSILLILVTSFSNSKMAPSYEAVSEQMQNKKSFDTTMEESVNVLTENNLILFEKVEKLNSILEEKEKIIEEYKTTYNEDVLKLQKAMSLYINDSLKESKTTLDSVIKENLNEENLQTYNNLIKKLN